MGSRGRRSAEYRRIRTLLQAGDYPCALRLPGCTGRGTTPEHDPPLHTAPTPEQWQGRYLPACPACQSRQGAAITNAKRRRARDWSW
jgi:hypothetical protein